MGGISVLIDSAGVMCRGHSAGYIGAVDMSQQRLNRESYAESNSGGDGRAKSGPQNDQTGALLTLTRDDAQDQKFCR